MKLRRSLFALVALAITAVSVPATAADSDARGCRDIIAAKVAYHPNRYWDEGLTVGGVDVDDGDDGWVYTGGGVVRVDELELAAPACATVSYTVSVYRHTLDDAGQPTLLGRRPLTVDGSRPTMLSYDSSTDPESPIGDDYPERCIRVVLETSAPGGKVFDRAADDHDDVEKAYRKVCTPDQARTWN